jgi:hypothetical protein
MISAQTPCVCREENRFAPRIKCGAGFFRIMPRSFPQARPDAAGFLGMFLCGGPVMSHLDRGDPYRTDHGAVAASAVLAAS